jgi:hypothetical protein
MEPGETYWNAIDPIWNDINIDSAESFQLTFSNVPRELGLLYAAHFCQSEICNGGFTQFFWNSTGVLAPEAIEGLAAIGQLQVADVVRRAVSMLGAPYPRDRAARWAALDELAPAADREPDSLGRAAYRRIDLFRPLEKEFYSLLRTEADGFENAADRYAAPIAPKYTSAASKHEALDKVLRDVMSNPETKSLKTDILQAKALIAEMRKKLSGKTEGEGGEPQS